MTYFLLPLRKYTEFSGRARRAEFWQWLVFAQLVCIGILVLALAVPEPISIVFGILSIIVPLALVVPSLAVAVRRMHDTNRSGGWVIYLVVVPVVIQYASSIVYYAVLFTSRGAVPADESKEVLSLGVFAFIAALLLPVLIFLLQDSTRGDNRFGPDPKGRSAAPSVT
ncbi:DUF805 domain-containing protein [Asticcacaulis sp. AC402]|uniref:DUF805 domain-containing protein n=1 Tax=Asticcacaulis sp. AC402 TaxID=1282361 RepID=UPI000417E215|nr:DUF805 domain-containing protein [Asticcacaulis sp. AC402]